MSAQQTPLDAAALDTILREVVESLAPIDRTPCSPGERQAAEWLAARLRTIPGVDVELEEEDSWGTFPPTSTGLGLLGIAAATLVLRGRRATGAALAAAAFAGIVDEAQNGPRVVRRLVRRRRRTVNLVARLVAPTPNPYTGREADGARGSGGGAIDTLVVIAHHDAPQSGMLFDQTLQRRLHERAPQVLARFKTPLPQWWIGLAVAAWRRSPARSLRGAASLARAWRWGCWAPPPWQTSGATTTVQGANDNLSGVAALVALARVAERRAGSRACTCCSSPAARRRRCRTASARLSRVIATGSIRHGRRSSTSTRSARRIW